MKLSIRTFAAAIFITGLGLGAQSGQATHQTSASLQAASSYMPAPACPPDDPDGCGIGPK